MTEEEISAWKEAMLREIHSEQAIEERRQRFSLLVRARALSEMFPDLTFTVGNEISVSSEE